MESQHAQPNSSELIEVAKVFLKLGVIGFGGPAVHIAMMEEEVVRKRKWFSHEHFLDLIGVTNLIPGPNSTEMALHCGKERAGLKGLLVAGACFILPAVIITAVIAAAYRAYGALPQVQPFINGIKLAIIGVIVSLMINLGRKGLKSLDLGIIGALAIVSALSGVNEIIVLFGGGALGMLVYSIRQRNSTINSFFPWGLLSITGLSTQPSHLKTFWIFLKIGSILYGSGYVLFAFLDTELVKKGLLSRQVLTDAIAVGQFTPGPVFSSATFIGWQTGGWEDAALATIGIFLPSFLFVSFLNPLVSKLRGSKLMSAFLDAVNITSIALILVVCLEMSRASVVDWKTGLIALLGFVVTFSFKKLNTAFVVAGGAVTGYLLSLI